MAKGKHANLAANRRYEAAQEHIDRLTSELADAKIRARDAEARANRLEGIEAHLERSSKANDDLVVALTKKNQWWAKVAKEDRERRGKAVREAFDKLIRDVARDQFDLAIEDRRQFLANRYPAILNALMAGALDHIDQSRPVPVRGTPLERAEWKLSDESLRRFQRIVGERGVMEGTDRDMADVLTDLLDAEQAGFSPDDMKAFALESTS